MVFPRVRFAGTAALWRQVPLVILPFQPAMFEGAYALERRNRICLDLQI
jgi:hypothetical protein